MRKECAKRSQVELDKCVRGRQSEAVCVWNVMAEAADSQPDSSSLNYSQIVDDGNSNLPLPTLSLLFFLSLCPLISILMTLVVLWHEGRFHRVRVINRLHTKNALMAN